MNIILLSSVVILYLAIIAFLGYKGYRDTKNTADYLIGGRKIHPYVMAMSYGATFISTAAIVGFGGVAGMFGMSVLWLTVLNIFVGVFIAFVFFGKRIRQMGHNLDSHTFPELLGRRFQSPFIQGISALIIVVFMPLYTSAVIIGASRLMEVLLNIDYNASLLIFAVIVTSYVFFGGLKGVMYTDALQGTIMFVGMFMLLIFVYGLLGGPLNAHRKLSDLDNRIEASYNEMTGELGEEKFNLLKGILTGTDTENKITTVIAGKEFTYPMVNDILAGIKAGNQDILASFTQKEIDDIKTVIDIAGTDNIQCYIRDDFALTLGTIKDYGLRIKNYGFINAPNIKGIGFQGWASMPKFPSPLWLIIITSIALGVGIGVLSQPQLIVRFMTVKSNRELNRAVLMGGIFILSMTGVAFLVGALSNAVFYERTGTISVIMAQGNPDKIIPTLIDSLLPKWFGYVFLLTILSAGMSTVSSLFHVMGTSFGRDIFEGWIKKGKKDTNALLITRVGIVITVVITVVLGYILPGGIIARATAIFFGITAAAFLPALVGGIYWRRSTKIGAIASMITGFISSTVWLTFFQLKEATELGICKAVFGKPALTMTMIEGALKPTLWSFTDAVVISLPISIVVFVVVSLVTKKPDDDFLKISFKKLK